MVQYLNVKIVRYHLNNELGMEIYVSLISSFRFILNILINYTPLIKHAIVGGNKSYTKICRGSFLIYYYESTGWFCLRRAINVRDQNVSSKQFKRQWLLALA